MNGFDGEFFLGCVWEHIVVAEESLLAAYRLNVGVASELVGVLVVVNNIVEGVVPLPFVMIGLWWEPVAEGLSQFGFVVPQMDLVEGASP
jgi:hypothetical protein